MAGLLDSYSIISLTLALLVSLVLRFVTSDCGQVVLVDRESRSDWFHNLWPQFACGSSARGHRCTITYKGKDSFVRSITQLCTGKNFYLRCYSGKTANIVISSGLDTMKIDCNNKGAKTFCAPTGKNLMVTYTGNLLCHDDMEKIISGFLEVFQRQTFSNVIRLSSNLHCYEGRSCTSHEVKGTIVSSIELEDWPVHYQCQAHVIVRYRTKKFCMKFFRFATYGNFLVKLELTSKHNHVELNGSNTATDDVFCLNIGKEDTAVSFAVKPQGFTHSIIFEYYSIFDKDSQDDDYDDYDDDDDDDDDDNDDLYWLFVIPGVLILGCCCCFFCCKKDKDEAEGAIPARPDGNEAQTPLQELGLPNQQGVGAGDASTGLIYASAMPSAPPIEPPPPLIGSGDEPPSYFALFPDQKQ